MLNLGQIGELCLGCSIYALGRLIAPPIRGIVVDLSLRLARGNMGGTSCLAKDEDHRLSIRDRAARSDLCQSHLRPISSRDALGIYGRQSEDLHFKSTDIRSNV